MPDSPYCCHEYGLPSSLSSQPCVTFANFDACKRLPQGSGQRLAVQPLQLGLVIERIDLRRPADHEQEDHRLGPRREMRRPRREGLQRINHRPLSRRSRPQLLSQQSLERQRAETGAKLAEESSSRTVTASVIHLLCTKELPTAKHS